MLDNGNFVLYNYDSQIIWQSFDYPTNTILAGQSLLEAENAELYSSVTSTNHVSRRFKLDLDFEGLLLSPVETPDDDSSYYWRLPSFNQNIQKLNLNDYGHTYLVTFEDTISKNITDGWPSSNGTVVIYRATLNQDGVFRLYSHSIHKNGSSTVEVKWQASNNKCSVNGICGFNSYYTLVEWRNRLQMSPWF